MPDSNAVDFEPGEVLFREGETSEHMYIIKEGQVGLFKKGTNGEELPVAVVGSGEFLGEMSLIQKDKRSATGVALSPVKTVKMAKSNFDEQIGKTPKWIQAMILGLVQRLYRTDEILRRHNVIDPKTQANIETIKQKFGGMPKKNAG